jgi:hypothetical protein
MVPPYDQEPIGPEPAQKLRLLVALPFAPRLDNFHGGRAHAQFLREIAMRHRVALVYLRSSDEPPADDDVAAHCERVIEVRLSSSRIGEPWRRRLDVLKAPFVGRPTSASVVYSAEFVRILRQLAEAWQPDVIQLENNTIAYCGPQLAGFAAAQLLVCYDPGVIAAQQMIAATRGRRRMAHRIDAHLLPHVNTSGNLDSLPQLKPPDADSG